jgi:hypothetical protein
LFSESDGIGNFLFSFGESNSVIVDSGLSLNDNISGESHEFFISSLLRSFFFLGVNNTFSERISNFSEFSNEFLEHGWVNFFFS